MASLVRVIVFFFAAWFVAATVDLWPRGEIRSFTAMRTPEPAQGLPEKLPLNPTSYRIVNDVIVARTGTSIAEYDDCSVFTLKNWRCDNGDGSGVFGMDDGNYYVFPVGKTKTISQLNYHILGCRWGVMDGPFQAFFSCVFGPFFQ